VKVSARCVRAAFGVPTAGCLTGRGTRPTHGNLLSCVQLLIFKVLHFKLDFPPHHARPSMNNDVMVSIHPVSGRKQIGTDRERIFLSACYLDAPAFRRSYVMATSQSTMDFLLDQLSGLAGLSTRKMFGEYCVYLFGKPIRFCLR